MMSMSLKSTLPSSLRSPRFAFAGVLVVATLKLTFVLVSIVFPAVSLHRTYRVYVVLVSPVSSVLCVVLPVVVNVFGMLPYVWSLVLHLHVAVSFVVTESVVFVVPAPSTWFAVGAVIFTDGGVVSGAGPPLYGPHHVSLRTQNAP